MVYGSRDDPDSPGSRPGRSFVDSWNLPLAQTTNHETIIFVSLVTRYAGLTHICLRERMAARSTGSITAARQNRPIVLGPLELYQRQKGGGAVWLGVLNSRLLVSGVDPETPSRWGLPTLLFIGGKVRTWNYGVL